MIPVVDAKFKRIDQIKPSVGFAPEDISEASVHQVVKAVLAGRRQGNAHTKNRAAVRGGGAKPFKQKGTGRARQGSTRAPNHIGGGRVFGPRRRSYGQSLNKKMVLKAVHSVLVDKFQAGKLTVVETIESNGRTKELFSLLDGRGLLPALIVTEHKNSGALRAMRNFKRGKGIPCSGFSVYEAVKYENLIIEKKALEILLERLVR